MSDLVSADSIEPIVGARRHPRAHLGRAVSAEQTVYILHSTDCKAVESDLRRCRFSIALDRGVLPEPEFEDRVLVLDVDDNGRLKADRLADWIGRVDDDPVELLEPSDGGDSHR